MILFTSGFPFSGKTTLSELLKKELDNKLVLHINPKDYYPDNYDALPSKDQIEIGVTAWEMSLETASKAIVSTPNKVLIVFDTCCSKSLHMRPLFMNSQLRGHHVFLVYVNASLEDRMSRTSTPDNAQKMKELEDRYKNDFSNSLPILRSHSDSFHIINNPNNKKEEMLQFVQTLADKIKRIRDG